MAVSEDADIVERLCEYSKDWRTRASSAKEPHDAIAEIERLRTLTAALSDQVVGWRGPDELPVLKRGCMKEYVLAVYREHSGKVYSFASSYLNAYPLEYRYECPKGDGCEGKGCDDGCPTTGWFVQVGDDDDGSAFQSLSLKDGDKIMGWRDIPQWDAAPPQPTEDNGPDTNGGES